MSQGAVLGVFITFSDSSSLKQNFIVATYNHTYVYMDNSVVKALSKPGDMCMYTSQSTFSMTIDLK